MGLALTEGGISFMNVTTYKCTKRTRERRILAVSAPANICYVLVSRTEAARSKNMETSCLDKDLYAQTDLRRSSVCLPNRMRNREAASCD